MSKLLAPLFASALLPALASAQLELCYSGGELGGNLTYELDGPPGKLWVLIPSTNAGPTPLALFDPADSRVLGVGIDLLGLAQTGVFTGAPQQVVYPVPNAAALQGCCCSPKRSPCPERGPWWTRSASRRS